MLAKLIISLEWEGNILFHKYCCVPFADTSLFNLAKLLTAEA
jgi:hypothetical protein